LTPVQIREKLADIAEPLIGADKVADVKELLKLKSTPNGGVAVTDELKYTSRWFLLRSLGLKLIIHAVKYGRQNGIHVSPTVLWDGLVAGDISSSWGEKEWTEFLDAKVSV
jgi:hypothetical protein